MSYPKNRIFITKTEKQWLVIDKQVKELGFKSYAAFLNSRIKTLRNDYNTHPDLVKKQAAMPTIKRRHFVPSSITIEFLEEIAHSTGIPISTIIDRIVIYPLIMV